MTQVRWMQSIGPVIDPDLLLVTMSYQWWGLGRVRVQVDEQGVPHLALG